MPKGRRGEGLRTRGSGATQLRLAYDADDVAGLLSEAVAGTAAADSPAYSEEGLPQKPESVSALPVLSKLWDEVVPMMARNGLLHEPDVIMLEAMLRHFAAFRDASDELLAIGPTIPGANDNAVKNPADAVMRSQSLQMLGYLKEFGLTLVSRAKRPSTGGTPTAGGDDNPFANTGT